MAEKETIYVGILEDNKEELLLIEDTLNKVAADCGFKLIVQFTSDKWTTFLRDISSIPVNTCILDIDLSDPSIDGMDIAQQISGMDKGINIIFLTGYDRFMGKAFKVGAFDYLLKPVDEEELKHTLLRLQCKLGKSNECLEINTHEFIRIPYKDIICAVYEDRRVKIITVDSVEILPSTLTLKSIAALLPAEKFIECSSYAYINMEFVKKVSRHEIELTIPGLSHSINLREGNRLYASQSGLKRVKDYIKKTVGM